MTDPQIKFAVLFQILAAVEGFSAWKGKSFIGKSVANFDDGPMFDRTRFDELRQQLSDVSRIGKVLWQMLRLYAGFKIARIRFAFVSKSKSILLLLARALHNMLGFALRCTPLFSIPALAICYIRQIGCKDDIVGVTLRECVFWFIAAKVVCYVVCAILNRIMLKSLSVQPKTSDMMDIGKAS